MDMKTFSEKDFDPKKWINQVFEESEQSGGNNSKQHASSMVMHLQLAIQEVNNTLEEASMQVVSTLPRVSRDIEALSHEAAILRRLMTNVKQDIAKVEHNTASSMQTLVELDHVKCHLEQSSKALKEADNWTTLLHDMEEVMDGGDVEGISMKLISLQNCLSVLTNVPDFEERTAILDGFKVRLEALASPHLIAAFAKHNLEESTKYATMLSALGRSKNLEGYYHKYELQQLANGWQASVEGHSLAQSPVYLSTLFDRLSNLIATQVKWVSTVFGTTEPCYLLSEICYSTLTQLNPSISHVVATAIKQQDSPLHFLDEVLALCEGFLKDYRNTLAGKNDSNALVGLHRKVKIALFTPIRDQMEYYREYEEAWLLSHLINAELVKKDILESLEHLHAYCDKIKTHTDEAVQRCFKLTKGTGFALLISAIESYVQNYYERLLQVSRHVEQQPSTIQEDWTVFNTCLNLIQTSGEFLMAVDSVESALATAVASPTVSKIRLEVGKCELGGSEDVFEITADVLLSESQGLELKQLIVKVIDEDTHLLPSLLTLSSSMCQRSVDVALDTIMGPVATQLANVPLLDVWTSEGSSLSLLALSPQEYITQIGQYLMTLPQHLEPLLVAHSPALNRAMQQNTNLQGASEASNPGQRVVSESEISAADFLIGSVGQSTCKLYADVILRIHDISKSMVKQLTTDIDYICTILEDLGVVNCQPLDKLNMLLKAPQGDYWDVAQGSSPRLVAAVRQMRGIRIEE